MSGDTTDKIGAKAGMFSHGNTRVQWHLSVQKNREKPMRNTAKAAQNVLLACPCLLPSFKATHLLSGVLEGSCLAQSDKQQRNNSHPRSKRVLERRHFNSKAN